jgi:glycosyltransferase involved in cell wall biosynthesis
MRLLVLTNNPSRASYRQRIGTYLEKLSEAGIFCEMAVLPKGMMARRRLFAKAEEFDGVFLHKKRLNRWDSYWLRRYSRKIIYDFDDAIMYSDRSPEKDSPSRRRIFARTVKLADMVIAGNEYLARQAGEYSKNVRVLATGLDVNEYHPCAGYANDGVVRLVWIGSRSTLKYLEGLQEALEEIYRRHNNTLLRIVADKFWHPPVMPVEEIPWTIDGQYEALSSSDIGLSPLPDNNFTRGKCGFKILQYYAAGLPVVASPVGVNSNYVQDGVTGFLAETKQQWIDRLDDLIENPSKRKNMSQAGRKVVEDKFNEQIIGSKLTELLKVFGSNL